MIQAPFTHVLLEQASGWTPDDVTVEVKQSYGWGEDVIQIDWRHADGFWVQRRLNLMDMFAERWNFTNVLSMFEGVRKVFCMWGYYGKPAETEWTNHPCWRQPIYPEDLGADLRGSVPNVGRRTFDTQTNSG